MAFDLLLKVGCLSKEENCGDCKISSDTLVG